MKKLYLLFAFITVLPLTSVAQELHTCDSLESYWAITKDSSFYQVKLSGKAKSTDRKNVISLNNYVLVTLLIDKAGFVKEGEDNSELNVLIRYALSEGEYFSGVFKKKIDIRMQKAPLSADKAVLIWSFEMPAGSNDQVKSQVFANMIYEDQIVGFGSAQFTDQKFERVRDHLMDVISTFKKVDSEKDFETLCRK